MNSVLNLIQSKKLIQANQKIGVAVSGGIDSMCLLHFLNSQKSNLKIELCAINIDHSIRQNSKQDSEFVKNYCKQNGIPCHCFKVDAKKFCEQNKLSLEEGARICRYNVFNSLLQKKIVDKIAIAHHKQDQVETILLNLFRGTGLKGASGMEYASNGYIRPFLDTDKSQILAYSTQNNIPFVEDETNYDTEFSRNFLRQDIIPQIKQHWQNFENNLINFSKLAKQDDDYINSLIAFDSLCLEQNLVKIPLNMFVLNMSIVSRLVRKSLEYLGSLKDIEQKHIALIANLAKESENGTRINLPNKLVVIKEYDYITILKKHEKVVTKTQKFQLGKQDILGYKTSITKKSSNLSPKTSNANCLQFDLDKLPKNAIWRTKQTGDMFTKFSGGTKKLKDYLIDKKVPTRIRSTLPVLACDSEVFVVYGIEISDKIKIDSCTKTICQIVDKNKK